MKRPAIRAPLDFAVGSRPHCLRCLFRYVWLIVVIALIANTARAQSPSILYLIPDIGSPGMNTYVEIIGSYGNAGSFGADGIYLNNPGDAVRVLCVNSYDTNKIKIGPAVVSENGQMISTQIFVMPTQQPNSSYWRNLSQQYRVPIRVIINGISTNVDSFYLVEPQSFGIKNVPGVIGSAGGWGVRSRRGAMIVDSMILLSAGTYSIDTSDCDPSTLRNDGYLPAVIISNGRISVPAGAKIDISTATINGAPGGGGGGHGKYEPCAIGPTPVPGRVNNGQGFSKGGGDYYLDATTCDPERNGLNFCPGGGCGVFDSSGGGGTGFPFSAGGSGPTSDVTQCQATAAGVSGGNGGSHNPVRGGGGGGNATAGGGGAGCPVSNGGIVCGNTQLVPLAGGSAGAGGNGAYCNISGSGGGGGGALALFSMMNASVNEMDANGADGETGPWAGTTGTNSGGGAGAGGGLIVGGKLSVTATTLKSFGGIGGGSSPAGASGGSGGAGRIRYDGPLTATPTTSPALATVYRGLSTDTSHTPAPAINLTGTGNGQPVRIYRRSETTPWVLAATVAGYGGNAWVQNISLPGTDTIFFLVAAQQVASPNTAPYITEPTWVLSQAAANLLWTPLPFIATIDTLRCGGLYCGTPQTDTFVVYNYGTAKLLISNLSLQGVNANAFSIVQPTTPISVNVGDSVKIVVQFFTAALGNKTATLVITSNDNHTGHNPWNVPITGFVEHVSFNLPDTIRIGNLRSGAKFDTVVVFTTTGTTTNSISDITEQNGPGWIAYNSPYLPYNVSNTAPNDSGFLRFELIAPSDTGSYTATYRVHVLPCGIDSFITFLVHVYSGKLDAPSSLNVGSITCGSTLCDTFSVRNTGNAPMMVNSISIGGNNPQEFIPKPVALPITLQPNGALNLGVCFSPQPGISGARSAAMILKTDSALSTAATFTIPLDGRKDTAGILIKSSTIDLGDVCVGKQNCGIDTIIGVGTIPDTITIFSILAANTAFSIASPAAPLALAVDSSKSIHVCFSPSDTGEFFATLVMHSQPCGDSTMIALRGRGISSQLTAIDTLVQFGGVKSGTTADTILRFVVTGNTTISAGSSSLSPPSGAIVIDSIRPKVPSTLHPGDTLIAYVHFTPSADGDVSAQFFVSTPTACSPAQSITITGRGISSSLLISKLIVPFGSFLCGAASRTDSTIITNTGAAALNVSCAIIGADATNFQLRSAANFSLAAGATQSILISCLPSPLGARSAGLEISTDDAKHPHDTVALTASLDTAELLALQPVIDFGSLPSCSPQRDSFALVQNTGTVNDTVNAIFSTTDFSVIATLPRIIAPGATDTIAIRFAPAVHGKNLFDTLQLQSKPCAVVLNIPVQGRTDSSAFTPAAFDVGQTAVGASHDTIIVFKNQSAANACVAGVSASPLFSVGAEVPKILAPNDTLQLHIRFSPTAITTANGFIDLQLICPCTGSTRITLTGEGVGNNLLIARATVTLPAMHAAAGTALTMPITISSSQNIASVNAQTFTARLSYNRSLLIPDAAMNVKLGITEIDTITFSGTRADTLGTIGTLKFISALGDSQQTSVHFESFAWDKPNVQTSTQDGTFTLDGICLQGGARLFNAKGNITLAQNRPNPFAEISSVDFEVIEAARTKLYLVDFLGRTVATIVDAELSIGRHTATINAAGLSSGAYALVLQTPTVHLVRVVEIAR